MTYYTVVIPYSNTPSLWHPTDKTGPFSTLTRGDFVGQRPTKQPTVYH